MTHKLWLWISITLILSVFSVPVIAAQGQSDCGTTSVPNKTGQDDLKLLIHGDGKLDSGHDSVFRVYSAPDGTQARVIYAKFASVSDAERQTLDWLKQATKVTCRENDKNVDGQLVNERILATRRVAKSSGGEFMVIRRDDLICYLIESTSLKVAMQVESLIRHK